MEPETERLGSMKQETAKFIRRFLAPLLVIAQLVIGHCVFADAKAYDGVWFLGFNLRHEVAGNIKFREAVSHALNRQSEEPVPGGVIPPGLNGYDPELKPYKYNPNYAEKLLKNIPVNKTLVLLHTDGLKTIAIAQNIQKDLKKIGLKVQLEQVPYSQEENWAKKLAAGKFDLFLMGYKAGINDLFDQSKSTPAELVDTNDLLEPLFTSKGSANFTGYANPALDDLLAQASGMDVSLKAERAELFRQIDRTIFKDIPVIGLFYIEKL